MIKQTVLRHNGGFYCYRLHNPKVKRLCNDLTKLRKFLNQVFEECPDNYFNSGPRSSTLKFKLSFGLSYVSGHEVSSLAGWGLETNKERYKDAHSKVQVFMLENDSKTIAMEIPIWLHSTELDSYSEIFRTKETLSGHIDLLRIEDRKIWVWDYKPNAHKEKYASTQVYFYATMLSKRTGIPLENFRCGYFDHNHAYMFKPEENVLSKNQSLNNF